MQLCWPDNYTFSITLRVCSEGLPVFPAAMPCLMPHWNIWTRIIPAPEGLIASWWHGPTWPTHCWGVTGEQVGMKPFHFDPGWNMQLQSFMGQECHKKWNAKNNFFPLHLFTSYPPSQYSLRAWRSMLRQSERTTSVKPRGSGLQHMVWLRTSEGFHQ